MADRHCTNILYTNHRGEKAWRHIVPEDLYWGSTDYHPEPQWLLSAYDIDKQAMRDFAMVDVEGWRTAHS